MVDLITIEILQEFPNHIRPHFKRGKNQLDHLWIKLEHMGSGISVKLCNSTALKHTNGIPRKFLSKTPGKILALRFQLISRGSRFHHWIFSHHWISYNYFQGSSVLKKSFLECLQGEKIILWNTLCKHHRNNNHCSAEYAQVSIFALSLLSGKGRLFVTQHKVNGLGSKTASRTRIWKNRGLIVRDWYTQINQTVEFSFKETKHSSDISIRKTAGYTSCTY